MKKTIQTVNQVNAPLDKVWAKVGPGTNMDKWMPIVATCRVEGDKRICGTHEAGDLKETILKSDDKNKVFQYRIDEQSMLPVTNIIGTMTLSEKNGGTQLNWDVEFDISEENAGAFEEIKTNTEGLYQMAATSLAEYVNAQN
ncbi:SRPBCC family protein [uncultured Aquimarina sp.]|uniref:SRPBCC family protein n=1 Tax=uncultured Aquimarina sp. TaxID=575652 RepID=UPI00261A6B61|nr:SRPBCC family protein [uncultured Aquimarina sp.]